MPTFEITVFYPERPFEEHRAFLASVAGSPSGSLDGYRRHGDGLALTYVIEAQDRNFALQQAHQRVAGMWPNFRVGEVEVSEL